MIKKIALCVIMGFLVIQSPVKAQIDFNETEKPIVVQIGQDYTRLLSIPGYDMLSSNVNWFEPGQYSVAYRIKNGTKIKHRQVIVLSKYDFLTKGYQYTKIHNQLFSTTHLEKEVLAHSIIDKDRFVIAFSEYNMLDQDAGSNIKISYIVEEVVQWEKTLREESFDYVTKIKIENNLIIGVGVCLNHNRQQDGWLFVIDLNGNVIHDITYYSNNRSFFYDVFAFDDSYIVLGKSNSNLDLFVNKKFIGFDYDAMMATIDKNTLQIKKVLLYGSNGDDSFEEAIYQNNHFYIRTKTEGLIGDFANGIDNRRTGIVKINIGGELQRMNFIPSTGSIHLNSISISNRGHMYLSLSIENTGHNQRMYQLYQLQTDTTFRFIDEYVYPSINKNIKVIELKCEEDSIILTHQLFAYRENQTEMGYYIRKYTNEQYVDEFEYIANDATINPIGVISDENMYLLVSMNSGIGGTKPTLLSTLKLSIKSIGGYRINQSIDEVENYSVLINQTKLVHDKTLSKTIIDYNLYGYYQMEYVFDYPAFRVAFDKEVYVADNINVSTGEIYSIGYQIKFNGNGYLNEKRILPNTIIEDPGLYVLEVYGKDQVKKMISFEIIDNIANKKTHFNYQQKPTLHEINYIESNTSSKIKLVLIRNNKPLSIITSLSEFQNWFFIFPAFCLPVSIISIYKGVKK